MEVLAFESFHKREAGEEEEESIVKLAGFQGSGKIGLETDERFGRVADFEEKGYMIAGRA